MVDVTIEGSNAIFEVEGKTFQAELPKKFDTKAEAEAFLKNCLQAEFSVANLEKKPTRKTSSRK